MTRLQVNQQAEQQFIASDVPANFYQHAHNYSIHPDLQIDRSYNGFWLTSKTDRFNNLLNGRFVKTSNWRNWEKPLPARIFSM